MTKRGQILDAFVTALGGVTGASVYRSRATLLGKNEYPAILVSPVNDRCEHANIGRYAWNLTVQVQIVCKASDADESDVVAESFLEEVHELVTQDATLQGLVVNLVPISLDWTFEGKDGEYAVAIYQFLATYQTEETDLE